MVARPRINACELKNKVLLVTAAALLVVASILALTPVPASASQEQPSHSQPRPDEAAPGIAAEPDEEQHPEAEEHGSVWAGLLWPTVNFAILSGLLYYFFKDSFVAYLRERHGAIRHDLVEAARVKSAAAAQLAEIDRRLLALPAEIAALRTRGAEEMAAEEARIAAQAAAERDRLLEQTRKEIDVQLRLAKRELVEHTADLAVQLAGQRLTQQVTPGDQDRLVDRYLDQVKEAR